MLLGCRRSAPAEFAARDLLQPRRVVRRDGSSGVARRASDICGFAAAPPPGSWTIRSTIQRSDSGRRSKLRSSARRPGSRTARSMSRKPPPLLAAAGLPLALELRRAEAGVDAAELEHAAHRRLALVARGPRGRRPAIRSRVEVRRGRARAASRSGCARRRRCPGRRAPPPSAASRSRRRRCAGSGRACARSGRGPCRRPARRRRAARASARRRPRSGAGSCSGARSRRGPRRPRSKWLAYQSAPELPVELGDEEVELLRPRHRDLGVQVEVVVQARRPALEPADHDQVRQRAVGARPAGAGGRAAALGREALARPRDHRVVGGIAARAATASAAGTELLRRVAEGLDLRGRLSCGPRASRRGG